MKRFLICISMLALTVALGGCPKKAPSQAKHEEKPGPTPGKKDEPKLRPLKVGIAIPSYVHAVAWMANDKGFFAGHAIDAEVVTMGGSSATMKGLVSGDIKIGLAGGDAAIKANLAGADLVVFGSVVTRHYHRLVVKGDIKKPADLKGKTIGLPFLGGPQDFLIYVLMKKWGLEYGKDVKVQNMGKEYARLVAIKEGKVDGITSAATKSKLDKLGLNILANPRTWNERAPYMMMVAQRSFLKENAGLVMDFMRSISAAQEFYMRHKNDALKIVFDKLGAKKGAAEENYVQGGPHMYELPPVPNMEAMKLALGYIATIKDLKAKASAYDINKMIDGSLVDKLVKEGTYTKTIEAQKALAAGGAPAKPAPKKDAPSKAPPARESPAKK